MRDVRVKVYASGSHTFRDNRTIVEEGLRLFDARFPQEETLLGIAETLNPMTRKEIKSENEK